MNTLKRIIILITCLLSANCANSQYVITKFDTISLKNDSILKITIPKYRGKLKWQRSYDNKIWENLDAQGNDTLIINSTATAFYRGEIVDNNCNPVYTDSVTISKNLYKLFLQLPNGISGKNIVINSLTDNSKSIGNNYHFINSNSSIVAYDTILNKPVYFGFPGMGERDTFQLNAKETALFLCLSSFPFLKRPAYKASVLSIKEALYDYPEVKALEKKIEEVIVLKGYLDYDLFGNELGNAINSIIESFGNLPENTNSKSPDKAHYDEITKIAHIPGVKNMLFPYWNQNYQGWYRVSNNTPGKWKDTFNQSTGIYQLKRSFYNQTPSVIGVKIGKVDKKANTAYPENAFIGFIEPYYPPNLLSVSGHIDNIKALGKSTWDMIQFGFIDGLTQTDAFSSEVELEFQLKESEKDAFVFLGPKDDPIVQGLNVLYVFMDVLSEFLPDKSFINKFMIFMVQKYPTDISNYVVWWQNGNYNSIIENIGIRCPEFVISLADQIKISEEFEKTLDAFLTSSASVYKFSTIAYKVLTLVISAKQNIDLMIPVYFDSDFDMTIPYVITRNVSDITESTAVSGGSIIRNGGLPITASGVCYSLSPNPEVNDYIPKTIDGASEGSFTSRLTNLLAGKNYYVRAYASNILGTGYGNQVIFTTNPGKPPEAAFEVTSNTIKVGESIEYIDKSKNNPTRWLWDFGDGFGSEAQNPKHTYYSKGIKPVSLKATNDFGSDTEYMNITVVESGSKPVAGFTASSYSIKKGESIQFTDQSTNSPTNWLWNFGDGSVTSSLQNPVHTYTQTGTFTVTLTASNSFGSSSKTAVITVSQAGTPPVADFTVSNFSPKVNEIIQFTDKSNPLPVSWIWNFGDGSNSTLQNPTKSYAATGTYLVSLTATNQFGSNSKTATITVSESGQAPEADFTMSNATPQKGESVQFTDKSKYVPTSWSWDFGDGTATSSLRNPSHIFTAAGTFTVKLTATNSFGSNSKTLMVTVKEPATLPVVTTWGVESINQTSVKSGGTVTSDGGSPVTARGVCWNTTGNPTPSDNKTIDGTGTGTFTSTVSPLVAGTTYYLRAYATNSVGTNYGGMMPFSIQNQPQTGTFTDSRDGHVYKWVQIGDQVWGYQIWMAENLAWLPSVSPQTAGSDQEPYYFVNGYTGTDLSEAKANLNYLAYGVLYNWPAAIISCPTGWHLPTHNEWSRLSSYLISKGFTGNNTIAKSLAAKSDWRTCSEPGTPGNDPSSNNSSGFSGLPAGNRSQYDSFMSIGSYCDWWSSTESSPSGARGREIMHDYYKFLEGGFHKESGLSVRCIKD